VSAARAVRRTIARAEDRAKRKPRPTSQLFAGTADDGSRFYHHGHDERPVKLPRVSGFRPRSYTPPDYREGADLKRAARLQFAPTLLPVHFYGVPTENPGRLNLRSTEERVAAALGASS
jgi:hypothetical protein